MERWREDGCARVCVCDARNSMEIFTVQINSHDIRERDDLVRRPHTVTHSKQYGTDTKVTRLYVDKRHQHTTPSNTIIRIPQT